MAYQNQTAFLNECKKKELDVTAALSAGISLQGVVTAHDQFTVILNDDDNGFNQQVDFLIGATQFNIGF